MPRISRRVLAPAVLFACIAFHPPLGNAAPRSADPALKNIRVGEAISERFLSRDSRGGVIVDLIIEGDVPVELLRGKGIEVNTRIGRLMTARCPLPLLPELLDLPGIERVQVSERCKPNLNLSASDVGVTAVRTVPPPSFSGQTGSGVLVGDVDTGIDYAHGDFKKADGTTRLVSIWDQTGTGAPPPAGFSYGAEWLPAAINAAASAEVDVEGHGSHVMGIAAGDGSGTGNGQPAFTYVGMAPEADLCMVKTTFATTDIVDGVHYIFQKAASLGKQAVVNLSLGTQYGPHDGTHSMDLLLNGLTGPGKIIVASAGNAGEDNLHGQVTVAPATPQSMTMVVPSYTRKAGTGNDFLLFSGWYEGGNQISLTITTPGGTILGPIETGSFAQNQNTADGYLNIFNGTTSPSNGDNEIYIELFDGFASKPPRSGTWTFTFTPVSLTASGRVDMYIYGNDLGDASQLAMWNQGLVVGGVVGSPGDADSIITAAAHTTKACWQAVDAVTYCWNPQPTLGAIAPFSSQGPRRDGVAKPDLSAPGFGVTSTLSSNYVAQTALIATDGVHLNFAGTSMSAPHITGGTALLLAQGAWANSAPSRIRQRLQSTARSDAFTGAVPNLTWGYGKLDIAAALAAPITLLVPHPGKGNLYAVGKYDSVNVAVTGFTADSVSLSLSLDGGGGYPTALGTLLNVAPGPPRHLTFLVDNSMSTNQAKVRAVAYQGGTTLTAFSDSLFVIAIPSAVQVETTMLPARFALEANAPNPFNPVTTIHFALDRAGPAALRVFSIRGALVRTLVQKELPSGRYRAQWDGRDEQGRPVGSGVYIYRLTAGGRDLARKMSLLK
ncbi:MAG TPA: S8 family serine peptidase [Candidatus Eisenbacteria bacterium]